MHLVLTYYSYFTAATTASKEFVILQFAILNANCRMVVTRRITIRMTLYFRCLVADKPLSGRVAIVTGSSSGIGEAIARNLALAGAKVALGARRRDRLVAITSQLKELGLTARYTVCDVTDPDQVSFNCICCNLQLDMFLF